VLDFGSAAKTTLFAGDVEKSMDGLFQQLIRARVRRGLFLWCARQGALSEGQVLEVTALLPSSGFALA
jgi:hypothetical protein